MEYTMEERCKKMIADCMASQKKNPIALFREIANQDYIRIHGPEHHILDGACILTAFYNAGGNIDLEEALKVLMCEGLKMPGAICGIWGVCGSVTSIGAALAIIDHTGPLTTDGTWGEHMEFTSRALERMAQINGPRCCKRNATISMTEAIAYVNAHYEVELESMDVICSYFPRNQECIKKRCPYFPKTLK